MLFEIEVLPNSPGGRVGIVSIKYGEGQVIPLQDLEIKGSWILENDTLIGRGSGSRLSYLLYSEKDGNNWGEVKVVFRQFPESGSVLIRMDGVNRLVELIEDESNGETLVVIPIVPSPIRVFLLRLCDICALGFIFFFISIWVVLFVPTISGKYRLPGFLHKVGDLLRNTYNKQWAPFVILFFYTLLAHGLLLFNEGIYSDDHLYVTYLIKRDWNALFSLFDQTGRPLIALMHWPFIIFPDIVFGYKVVIFLLIFLSAILIFQISKRSGYFTRTESLLLAILSITFPANQFFVAIGMSSYYILYTIFLFAVYLDIISLGKHGNVRLILLYGSVALFFFSFTLSSLLVYLLWLSHNSLFYCM